MKITFSPPDITEAEIEEVVAALRSGWITTGHRTKQFEQELTAYCGAQRVVCLGSATVSLEMILRALGIGEGDEVITSAYTYTASASPVLHVGATLKLVDTAPDAYEMDYDALEAAITDKTKVIIPVDLGGVMCDYDRIFEIVERKKALFCPQNERQAAYGRVIVVADCAHALGSQWHGKRAGAVADFTFFSFHAVKNLTTAEGGAIAWRAQDGLDGDALYRELQLLSLHGQSKDALDKMKTNGWEYDILTPAYKCNMTDLAAALGLSQLKRYEDSLCRRHALIERYDAALHPYGIQTLTHTGAHHRSNGHLYLTRLPGITAPQRGDIITKMAEQGITTNVHFKPLPMMTAYRNLGFSPEQFPNACRQFENEISLPLHNRLTAEEVDYVCDTYITIQKEYR